VFYQSAQETGRIYAGVEKSALYKQTFIKELSQKAIYKALGE